LNSLAAHQSIQYLSLILLLAGIEVAKDSVPNLHTELPPSEFKTKELIRQHDKLLRLQLYRYHTKGDGMIGYIQRNIMGWKIYDETPLLKKMVKAPNM
jgi:hypothetical protein